MGQQARTKMRVYAMMNKVGIEKCRPDAVIPAYARAGDAGMDVVAAEDVILAPGETKAIATGLKFILPEDMEIQVRPRSGLSLNTPLRLANSPGTIDAGYKDELRIILHNSSCTCSCQEEVFGVSEKGNKKGSYRIKKGDRIAQLVFARLSRVLFTSFEEASKDLNSVDDRGGGFGSTGHSI